MHKEVDELSRVKEIGFMGKVTASLSHEIKNTLAIIYESAGLMGDLLQRDAPDDWPQYSRLTSLLASIVLAHRFATLRRVNLETQLELKPLHLLSDPFRLLYVIFGFIERAINCSPKEAQVTVKTERSGEMFQVTVTDQGTVEADKIRALVSGSLSAEAEQGESDLALLAQTIEALGGTIAAEQGDGGLNKVILSFPASMPGI
jgi:C4-dicarboxylate-specific signal transduction histidine kinase